MHVIPSHMWQEPLSGYSAPFKRTLSDSSFNWLFIHLGSFLYVSLRHKRMVLCPQRGPPFMTVCPCSGTHTNVCLWLSRTLSGPAIPSTAQFRCLYPDGNLRFRFDIVAVVNFATLKTSQEWTYNKNNASFYNNFILFISFDHCCIAVVRSCFTATCWTSSEHNSRATLSHISVVQAHIKEITVSFHTYWCQLGLYMLFLCHGLCLSVHMPKQPKMISTWQAWKMSLLFLLVEQGSSCGLYTSDIRKLSTCQTFHQLQIVQSMRKLLL